MPAIGGMRRMSLDRAIHNGESSRIGVGFPSAQVFPVEQRRESLWRFVQFRVFTGLSVEQAADLIGMSRATAYRHWTYARAWIRAELLGDDSSKESPNP